MNSVASATKMAPKAVTNRSTPLLYAIEHHQEFLNIEKTFLVHKKVDNEQGNSFFESQNF